MAQAQQYIINDNGGTYKNICADYDNNCFKNSFIKYLKTIKNCDDGTSIGSCWASPSVSSENFAGAILPNGTFLMFRYESSDCSYTEAGEPKPRCGWIRADVNGNKFPNTYGIDTFTMRVLPNSIIPADEDNANDCITNPTSEACSTYYLYH